MHVVVTIGLGTLLMVVAVVMLISSIASGRRRRRKQREREAQLRAVQETKRLKALERDLSPPRSRLRFWRR